MPAEPPISVGARLVRVRQARRWWAVAAGIALVSAAPAAPALTPETGTAAAAGTEAHPRLAAVAPLFRGQEQPFQARFSIESHYSRTHGLVSWQAPDRRALVVLDQRDCLPLMLAVDGRVLYFDVVTGAVLLIRAEPEVLLRALEGRLQIQAAFRADFDDPRTQRTLEIDPSGTMRAMAAERGETIRFHDRAKVFSLRAEPLEMELALDENDRLKTFLMRDFTQPRALDYRITELRHEDELPAWHRLPDLDRLREALPVIEVRHEDQLELRQRLRLQQVLEMVRGGAGYLPRQSLHHHELEQALRQNSPVRLDFDRMRESEQAMHLLWLELLEEQGFRLPEEWAPRRPATDEEGEID